MALSGSPPEKSEALQKAKVAYLTTIGRRTGAEHSVELWFSFAAGRIFLSHEGNYTDWMKNIASNKHVRIRIGKVTLDGYAMILGDGESNEVGKRALYEKYYGPASKATIDDWFELSTIIELTLLR